MVYLETNMRKILLMMAALVVAAPVLGGSVPGHAEGTPSLTPEDRVMGKADAPITIIEYASLTCPHCAAFDTETLPKLKEEWIDTGKAKLAFRNFPLDQAALKAAVLTMCAPPERYFAFVDVLFRSQAKWISSDPTDALSNYAKLGGISQQKFDACMADQKLTDQIVAERFNASKDYDVKSTPTFFINGTKVVGALPLAEFEKTLNAAMPKS
jgi:protein-disulfide isomerase